MYRTYVNVPMQWSSQYQQVWNPAPNQPAPWFPQYQPTGPPPKYPAHYGQEALPLAMSNFSAPMVYTNDPHVQVAFKPSIKQHTRHCIDYLTTITLFMVWTFLVLSCIVFLLFSHVAAGQDSERGSLVSGNEIGGTLVFTAIPIVIATILNEVLIDRCWRRVIYSALGSYDSRVSDKELGKRLRAANFGWLNFTKRLFTGRVSRRDFRALVSYALLRWGTAISIASTQLCVRWIPEVSDSGETTYTAYKRPIWIFGPIFLHASSVFGTMLIWWMPPWRFFSDRFHDPGLLRKYTPYLQKVLGGSIAKFQDVAEILDPRTHKSVVLSKKHQPGIQFVAKLKGIWFGLIAMNVPPALAWVYFRYVSFEDILQIPIYRSTFHFVFLAQNILYLLALDFVVWNLSLEGFCKGPRSSAPNDSLRHLGYSSGIMLFIKAIRQRRPLRAAIFMWLFWLQACMIRGLTVLYALCVTVFSYGTYDDRDEFYDPFFWVAWLIMTNTFTLPLFLIWLFTKFQVPICDQDGWRWAKIAQNALVEPGFYGVRNGQAVWGPDVDSFENRRGELLF